MVKIIALQACRHGIGCSHLVANLAVILMNCGYRVGLLETDLQAGGIRTLFGLDKSLAQDTQAYWWLSSNAKKTPALQTDLCRYEIAYENKATGIYLPAVGDGLAANSEQFRVWQERYDAEKPFDVFQGLSQDLALDFLLVDNQPEMTNDNLMGLSIADVSVVLMQLDTYDLQRTAVLLEVIKQLEVVKTWLVPTLVLPSIERGVVKHMLENTYGYPVAGILHLSDEMASFASQGLFCLHYPKHFLTQTMMTIAHQLEQDAQALSMFSKQS
ncbi:ParA family protein [Oscillatoria sp. CS-180]|uniref:MinD/ParA family ATP-binding protein n=1 Tax=Oscillatoria sp. CS-180 TaxID=3021720 RepID=UPI00232BD320|nr:ParA family protein [Oscillatoria sp. CS-180]MDB9528433.1 ParA family protein [Oscillatoria sp. CS-180]